MPVYKTLVINQRVAVHECRRGCAVRGHKNDCQISRLNGWIKGCEVPLLRQEFWSKEQAFTDSVIKKCSATLTILV